MAEKYGFFDAIIDPDTGEYDRIYSSEEFSDYFDLLTGNGVFSNPSNQLKVTANSAGLVVNIAAGWAFINGHWYNNDSQKSFTLSANLSEVSRVDSIRLRMSLATRTVSLMVAEGDVTLVRGETTYDLELAQVTVTPGASILSASDIEDKRPNPSRCGFVQNIDTVSELVQNIIDGNISVGLAREAGALTDEVLLLNQVFEFTQSGEVFVCRINNTKVTADSLIDVYFDSSSYEHAANADIIVDSYNGYFILTAVNEPADYLSGDVKIKVV